MLPFSRRFRAGKSNIRHQHRFRPHGPVPDRRCRPEQPAIQHHTFAQLRCGRDAARHLRACGHACALANLSQRQIGRTSRRGADSGRFPQQRNISARAAPRQRRRQRRLGAAGAYRAGADRRIGSVVPRRNRLRGRSDEGVRHNAAQAPHPRRAGADQRHSRDDGNRHGEPRAGPPPARLGREGFGDAQRGGRIVRRLHGRAAQRLQAPRRADRNRPPDARNMRIEPPPAQARNGTLQRRHGRGSDLQAQGAALLFAALHAPDTGSGARNARTGGEDTRRRVQFGGRQSGGGLQDGDHLPRRQLPRRLRFAGDGQAQDRRHEDDDARRAAAELPLPRPHQRDAAAVREPRQAGA